MALLGIDNAVCVAHRMSCVNECCQALEARALPEGSISLTRMAGMKQLGLVDGTNPRL